MASEEKEKKKPGRLKNMWANVALRCSLLRIWLMKNLTMFLTTILLAILIIIITGNGHILPLIGMAFKGVKYWNVENTFWQNLLAVLGGLATPIAACAILLTKTRSIALADIKSPKTKRAMIKAGLYFDKNGKLAKQKHSKHPKKEPSNGFFSKMVAPVKEFALAITASIKDIDDETVEKKVSDESVDIGTDNVEKDMSDPTIIETLAPTIVSAASQLVPTTQNEPVDVSSTDNDNKGFAPVEEQLKPEADKPAETDITPIVDENGAPSVDEKGDEPDDEDIELEPDGDDTEADEDEYEDDGLFPVLAALGELFISICEWFRKKFTRTEEQKAAAAERKALRKQKRAATKEERKRKKEEKKMAKEAKKAKALVEKAEKTAKAAATAVKDTAPKVMKPAKKAEEVVDKTPAPAPKAPAPAPTGNIRRRPVAPSQQTPPTPPTTTIRRRR